MVSRSDPGATRSPAAVSAARRNGSAWSTSDGPAGSGTNHTIRALTICNDRLIAGGRFTQAGGQAAHHIASHPIDALFRDNFEAID